MVGVGSAAVPAVDSSREWELIDAVIGGMIRRHDTTRVQEQRARGGIVLWFNVRDAAEKELAMQIRQEPGAYDVMCTSQLSRSTCLRQQKYSQQQYKWRKNEKPR